MIYNIDNNKIPFVNVYGTWSNTIKHGGLGIFDHVHPDSYLHRHPKMVSYFVIFPF